MLFIALVMFITGMVLIAAPFCFDLSSSVTETNEVSYPEPTVIDLGSQSYQSLDDFSPPINNEAFMPVEYWSQNIGAFHEAVKLQHAMLQTRQKSWTNHEMSRLRQLPTRLG